MSLLVRVTSFDPAHEKAINPGESIRSWTKRPDLDCPWEIEKSSQFGVALPRPGPGDFCAQQTSKLA